MSQSSIHRRSPAAPTDIERLLSERYSQLMSWGVILTRGDAAKAQDIVQELCLYFALKKPDLSNVENVDGYLYTSLRHIYLSGLARASREAAHFISIADFDSFGFAITSKQTNDPLQRQNDLRSICSYAIWRKERSKTASYFILHFFHGYSRQEVADLARLPISAIYNKLKLARTEIKSHLQDSEKLRIIDRDAAPLAPRSWTLSSAIELFRELRDMILRARMRECLPEEQLLAYYRSSTITPIPCSLLSHIVSCEQCLHIIDSYFERPGLTDREPLDSVDSTSERETSIQLMQTIRPLEKINRRSRQVFEHRPKTLSIALNGRIIASHDVQSPQSTLSARIVTPERDQFIEVFSEQDVRFALLSVEDLPPNGPSAMEQLINLSDARWLKLLVTFDGQGLHSEVTYFDQALNADATFESFEEGGSETVQAPVTSSVIASRTTVEDLVSKSLSSMVQLLKDLMSSPTFAWALMLALIAGGVGYLILHQHNQPLDARGVLDQSIQVETAALKGNTEHQIIRVEELSLDGQPVVQGTIEIWKDGDDSRYIRRLYDSRHRLVAATWKNKRGAHSHKEEKRGKPHDQNAFIASEVGDQDLSATAFRKLGGKETLVATPTGYELTTAGPIWGKPHFTSATLILDKNFVPAQEIFEIQNGRRKRQLRLTQISMERKASLGVPDSVFEPEGSNESSESGLHPMHDSEQRERSGSLSVRLDELQIAVLYQLSDLHADVGEPIELTKTTDGRMRVSGSISDPALRLQIINKLRNLEDGGLLDLHLSSPNNLQNTHLTQATPGDTSIYELGTVEPMIEPVLRKYLQSRKTPEERLNAATSQYSQSVLLHSERALQDSYALNRLADVFSASEIGSINLESRRQWAEMVEKHSDSLLSELIDLRQQLVLLASPPIQTGLSEDQSIENAEQFSATTSGLLRQVQDVNRDIGILFTANTKSKNQDDPSALLTRTSNAVPLYQAEVINRFAKRLSHSNPQTTTGETKEGYERKK